uniref:Uncharacterized protein n=1 Tax=Setaria viridis TaxID=4556 RepID=A0A4U6T5Y7_SETVI|nr:LOW QUALITY PROTEIN: hypothetical protein SEVIR_9G392800v2 [Setaria viridis]
MATSSLLSWVLDLSPSLTHVLSHGVASPAPCSASSTTLSPATPPQPPRSPAAPPLQLPPHLGVSTTARAPSSRPPTAARRLQRRGPVWSAARGQHHRSQRSARPTSSPPAVSSGGGPGSGSDPALEEQRRRQVELAARIASGEFTVQGPAWIAPLVGRLSKLGPPGELAAALLTSLAGAGAARGGPEIPQVVGSINAAVGRAFFVPLYDLFLTYGGIFRLNFGPKPRQGQGLRVVVLTAAACGFVNAGIALALEPLERHGHRVGALSVERGGGGGGARCRAVGLARDIAQRRSVARVRVVRRHSGTARSGRAAAQHTDGAGWPGGAHRHRWPDGPGPLGGPRPSPNTARHEGSGAQADPALWSGQCLGCNLDTPDQPEHDTVFWLVWAVTTEPRQRPVAAPAAGRRAGRSWQGARLGAAAGPRYRHAASGDAAGSRHYRHGGATETRRQGRRYQRGGAAWICR